MKKILLVLCSLLFSFNLIACSNGSYEEIPEKYINYIYNGEAEKFFEEYASDLAKQLYCGTEESDYEKYITNVEKSSDELLERNNRLNKKFEYKSFEIYKEYSSEEVKEYNKFYEARGVDVEKFTELLHLTIYYDEYKNDQLEKEHFKGMLIGKYKGEWKFIRFFG